MLVQSGKPVGVMQTHEWAPRVLIANSNLVGDWANWEEFRRLEDLGLTMYGQMTAGSWIYIGTQGILQGTFETFAAVADKRFGGTLAGTITLTAGLGGMGGAQPLAVTMNDGVAICIECDPARIQRRIDHRYLDVAGRLARGRRARWRSRRATRGGRCRSACSATPPRCCPQLLEMDAPIDIVTDQTSAHDPLFYLPVGVAFEDWDDDARPRTRPASPSAPGSRWPRTCGRWSSSRTRAPRSSTTATRSATRPARAATTGPSSSRASCRRTSGRCSARARARSAGPRSPATRPTSPRPTGRSSSCSPTTSGCASGSRMAGERVAFQGLPARICWLGYGERHLAGLKFNEMVASGELKAPIVIGRDHLDCGSVASPYRETEAMLDGSDAIADWAMLNALVNTASGATWVSFHHGGGVGMGRSLHAGQVTVADGTELAAQKIERVLTNDPGMGVIRHVDAGYDRAVEVAEERGVRIPMREGSPCEPDGSASGAWTVSTFYALFSATCFALARVLVEPAAGQPALAARPRDPVRGRRGLPVVPAPGADGALRAGRRAGTTPIWRISFVAIAAGRSGDHAPGAAAQPALRRRRHPDRVAAVVLYALVALVGAGPRDRRAVRPDGIQVEAILLILLVLLAHGLVWRFMTERRLRTDGARPHERHPAQEFREIGGRFGDVAAGVRPTSGTTRPRSRSGPRATSCATSSSGSRRSSRGPGSSSPPGRRWTTTRRRLGHLQTRGAGAARRPGLGRPGAQQPAHRRRSRCPQAVSQFFTGDVFMHTWDLARATGQDDTLDPERCAAMLAGTEPYEDAMRGAASTARGSRSRRTPTCRPGSWASSAAIPGWKPPTRSA